MTYISPKRLANKYKIYAMPAIVAVIILFLFWQFLQPKMEAISNAGRELDNGSKQLALLTKKANDLSALDKNDLKERFQVLSSAVPAEKDVPGFMLGVQRMANEASVSVGLIEVNPGSISTASAAGTKELKKIATTPLFARVTIKGTVNSIIAFISKAVKARRLLKLEGINLSTIGAQKANDQISLILSISIYYQPLPPTLGIISLPLEKFSDEEEKTYQQIKAYTYYSYLEQPQANNASHLPETTSLAPSGSVPVGKIDLFNR
ncbi:type 4a pilus biogenesis protein PilO [Candidatus Gottesmanbacteria bacterium]|nr:type 4a pilus biogenesis protein PilO [Candidatus Gottesmanbacteria bacterium]